MNSRKNCRRDPFPSYNEMPYLLSKGFNNRRKTKIILFQLNGVVHNLLKSTRLKNVTWVEELPGGS